MTEKYHDAEASYLRRHPDRHEDKESLWPVILAAVILYGWAGYALFCAFFSVPA